MNPRNFQGWTARSTDYPRYVPLRDAIRRDATRARWARWGLVLAALALVASFVMGAR